MMDVDEENQRLKVTYADGVSETFTFPGFGDNAVQRVQMNKQNVMKVEVMFPGSGAITEINFCPECLPQIDHDWEHHCLVAGEEEMKAVTEYEVDDFEDSDPHTVVEGWTHGRADATETGNFTAFLGRYAHGMEAPYKTFWVNKKAETVIIDLDFYKLDGEITDIFDQDRRGLVPLSIFVGGEEINTEAGINAYFENLNNEVPVIPRENILSVFVDGEEIDLREFYSEDFVGHFVGETENGIKYSFGGITGDPEHVAHQGFNSEHASQKYHIQIQVPKTTRMFDDGKLRLLLKAETTGDLVNESAGWDNVRFAARFGCVHATATAPGSITESPSLDVCQNFAVHAGGAVTLAANIIRSGDVGSGGAITWAGATMQGGQYVSDSSGFATDTAVRHTNLIEAGFNAIAIPALEMGGATFTKGTHHTEGALLVTSGNVILDGGGDVNSVFLFQGLSFTAVAGTRIILSNGAKAENVLWAMKSAYTAGANSFLEGSILAETITIAAGCELRGCAIADGAITFGAGGWVDSLQP